VTAVKERLGVRRVLTSPILGAFAMITSTRSLPEERTTVSLEDFIEFGRGPKLALVSRLFGAGNNSARSG